MATIYEYQQRDYLNTYKSQMINYERHIRNALERLNTPDTGLRLRVYRAAMQAFENKFGSDTTGEVAEQRNHLSDAIQRIEAKYRSKS